MKTYQLDETIKERKARIDAERRACGFGPMYRSHEKRAYARAQQFELPATADCFNLAGEIIQTPETQAPATSDNRTPELELTDWRAVAELRSELNHGLLREQREI